MRDTQVVSSLRFTVEGTMLRRVSLAKRPELLIGQSPAIGPGNEGDYRPVTEGGA